MSQEAIIGMANNQVAVPSVIIVLLSTLLLFALGGLFVKSKGKYYTIWALASALSLVIALFILLAPNLIASWFN